MVTWDGSHEMVTWDGSHGMVTWDGHMGLSHGMGHMGWSNGMGAIFNQSEVSISFKTGGYTKQGTIKNFLTKPRNTGKNKNVGGARKGGGRSDGMVMDPGNGNGKAKLSRVLKSSVCLGKKKLLVGAKSKAGKKLTKKLGGTDSSQPGIRKFLMQIDDYKKPSNGNSQGNRPNSFKYQ